MVYFLGSILATAAANQARNSRARAEAAQWHSPLGQLGRCGILSLRIRKALDDTLHQAYEAALPDGLVGNDVRLPWGGALPIVVAVGGRAAVVEPVIGPDVVAAVQRADEASTALAALTSPGYVSATLVCRADTEEEPRALPGPSGRSVTVTGLSWLSGLLRQRLSDAGTTELPAALAEPFAAAEWRARHQWNLSRAAARALPSPWWWFIRDLYLDDGGEPIDLALAGPGGVFAVKFSMSGTGDCLARVSGQCERLRRYLFRSDVVPVVATATAPAVRFGPSDAAGNPVAWLDPQHLLGFLSSVRRRGVVPQDVAMLNAPAHGWYRRLEAGPDGAASTLFGWTS